MAAKALWSDLKTKIEETKRHRGRLLRHCTHAPTIIVSRALKNEGIRRKKDLLEVVFSCSNGYFSGHAQIYATSDDLSALADALIGFPSRPNDCRDFALGTFNVDRAGGGARMHFFCMDAAGHAVVEVKLRGDACRALGEMQSVAFRIPIQAAGVDDFIKQLRALERSLVQVPICGKPHRNRARYCA